MTMGMVTAIRTGSERRRRPRESIDAGSGAGDEATTGTCGQHGRESSANDQEDEEESGNVSHGCSPLYGSTDRWG